MRVTAGQVIGNLHLCPACGGSGERRDRAAWRHVSRCPQCGGSGRRLRLYEAARYCAVCGRVFQPPLDARGRSARVCHWCLANPRPVAPRPVAPPPRRAVCRRCAGPLERSARGRPPVLCRVCSPRRRSYTPRALAGDRADPLPPSSGGSPPAPRPGQQIGAADAPSFQGHQRPTHRERDAPGGRAAARPDHPSLPAAQLAAARAGGSAAPAGARPGRR
jgi:hypothetical protein